MQVITAVNEVKSKLSVSETFNRFCRESSSRSPEKTLIMVRVAALRPLAIGMKILFKELRTAKDAIAAKLAVISKIRLIMKTNTQYRRYSQ